MRSPNSPSSPGSALPARGCSGARRLVLLLTPVMLVATLGCREGPTDPEAAPAPPPVLATGSVAPLAFHQVSPGDLHSCGVTVDHLAYCWGHGTSGQLGTGVREERRRPVAVSGGLRFRQVSAGWAFACGVTTDDRGYCWGFNGRGQLGDGTETTRLVPVAVAGNLRFRLVSAGSDHACAVTTDQRAYCWGLLTDDGPVALGNGSTVGSATPVRVAGGFAFRQVSAGTFPHLRPDDLERGILLGDQHARPNRRWCGGNARPPAAEPRGRRAPVQADGRRRFAQLRRDAGLPGVLLGRQQGGTARQWDNVRPVFATSGQWRN